MKRILCIVVTALMIGSNATALAESIKANNINEINIGEVKKEAVKIKTDKIEYENNYVKCDIEIPVVEGINNKSAESKINKLFSDGINSFQKQLEKDAKESYESSSKEAIEFRKYAANSKFKVSYNKNNLLSITITYYSYTGGAHGMAYNKSYNIDLNTGNEAFMEDFFSKDEDYRNIIINNIDKQMKNDPDKYFPDANTNVRKISQDQDFYIEDGNIVVYYQLYEIAPYCCGMPEFKIPFSQFKKGFNLNIKIKDPAVKVNKKNVFDFKQALNVELKIPVIDGIIDKKMQEEINNKINDSFEKNKSEMETQSNKYLEDANKNKWNIVPYALDSDYFISYNHKNLLSLTTTTYKYTGGAHGSSNIVSYNIDINEGKELELKSMFKDNYDFKSAINNEIKKQMKESENEYFKNEANDFKGISQKQDFYIEDGVIVIYFQQYEIAPYSFGTPKYRIPLSVIKDGLKDDIVKNF